jgi:ribosomal protein S18 acetylase RimI-like enzyme
MSAHPLDRPVWNMLRGRQAHLAVVSGTVCRIDPAYGPFAAAAPGHQAELAVLLTAPADEIWIVETAELAPPAGTQVLRTAALLQMFADGPVAAYTPDPEIEVLAEADAAEMAALAYATEPGPWRSLTHRYGTFYGLRREGRIVAMAGERMRPAPDIAEVSGVCTLPDFRGQGMAARLIRHVMAGFAARGDTPFLHSYAHNTHAIRLYESLGFRARSPMVVTVLGRAET